MSFRNLRTLSPASSSCVPGCADNPDYQIVLKAGYVNASAFRAELYRQQEARKISDALLAVRLNTSTLLHTRLAWRPNTLTDMQVGVGVR